MATKQKEAAAPATAKKYRLNPEKPYNPKAAHNVRSWEALKAALPGTLAELTAAMVYNYKDENKKDVEVKHANFVGYMVRGKHIVPA